MMKDALSPARPIRGLVALGLTGLLGLSGCVAYPADAYYAQPAYAAPAQIHVAPPALYFGGSIGPSYRGPGYRGPGYHGPGYHGPGGYRGHGGPRHWR